MEYISVHGLADLPRAVSLLLPQIEAQTVVALYGKMGAGKTTLIKELCKQLGVVDVVNSPTFSLVNEYRTSGGKKIFHFDFYRINKLEEAYDFGYEEYFFSGNLCLVEWPEKVEPLLPEGTLCIQIEEMPNGARSISIL